MGIIYKTKPDLVDEKYKKERYNDNKIEVNITCNKNEENSIINNEKNSDNINNNKNDLSQKEYEEEQELFLKINKIKCLFFYSKIYKWDIVLFIINIISYCIYAISLESCGFVSTNVCTDIRGLQWYYKIVALSMTAGIIQGIFLILIFIRCEGYKHLIYDIPIFIILFFIYNGTRVDEHGLYNSIFFIVAVIITTTFLLFISYFIYFFIRKSKITFLFIALLIIIIILRYNFMTYDFCENWTKNINGTIDSNKKDYPCNITIPKKCSLDKLGGIVDLSKIFRAECHLPGVRKKEKEIFLDSIKYSKYFGSKVKNFQRFAYPITLTPDYEQRWMTDNNFATYVNEKTILLDYYEDPKEKSDKYPNELPPEITLTFDDQGYGIVNQKINFNETLSKERKKISDKKNPLFKNIFMFYIDSLSHKHFQRKLPKTTKLFKKYFLYNENYSEKKFTAFEFNKYHSLGKFTLTNIYAMNYGFPRYKLSEVTEKGVSFTKYLKENGYITGSAGTICSKDSLFADEFDDPSVNFDRYDHENVALFCDRNYYDTGYSLITGINSVIHRCLYGKKGYKYAFEYAELFWNSYKDNNKFFRLHLYESHELTLELIKYSDDDIYNFFNNFINKGYFNDTLLLLVSDHGNNFGSYYNLFEGEDKNIEGMLPLFMILIPNKKIIYKSGMYNNLYENQFTFITPFDIYNSIIHASSVNYSEIITEPKTAFERGGKYSWRGYSIFNLIDYKSRYCDNHKLGTVPSKCVCQS